MASANSHYPDYLNPFGEDEEEPSNSRTRDKNDPNDYPDHLSPFGEVETNSGDLHRIGTSIEDYDSSLNPFGENEVSDQETIIQNSAKEIVDLGNPLGNDEDGKARFSNDKEKQQDQMQRKQMNKEEAVSKISSPQPDSLEAPPIPLPRTKSLLKKEQASKRRQQREQQPTHELVLDPNQPIPVNSGASSPASSPSLSNNTQDATTNGSFQRRKNKRNAPPVPVNFKRTVSGSPDGIEEELNDIGDKLAIIEKESIICRETLESAEDAEDADFLTTRNKFVELIKKKNSILRRQRELMFKKRELKLDQIHSDIEYELRMIGNKQLSHRTTEDEVKEKELLKKLVEIVEEKSDIVENLNKDTFCDSYDVAEALKRLNIKERSVEEKPATPVDVSPITNVKNGNCDKSSVVAKYKLSKIATLLPKGRTIKGTMKIKRKRLFKKNCDSLPIER